MQLYEALAMHVTAWREEGYRHEEYPDRGFVENACEITLVIACTLAGMITEEEIAIPKRMVSIVNLIKAASVFGDIKILKRNVAV